MFTWMVFDTKTANAFELNGSPSSVSI